MTELSPSAEFLDSVADTLRNALATLDSHEATFERLPVAGQSDHAWSSALGRLGENLSGWQTILGDMAERVRVAQDDLAGLDTDLKRSLDAFAAARKHLQGEATSGVYA